MKIAKTFDRIFNTGSTSFLRINFNLKLKIKKNDTFYHSILIEKIRNFGENSNSISKNDVYIIQILLLFFVIFKK